MEVRLGWETFLLIVRIEFICKSHALCNLSHGRMNIWGDSVPGQISFPYTQKTTALEQKTQKTTALEQKTVFRSRAAVFWVYGKLIWPWYEESNTWFLQAILSLGPDSEKVRLVLKVGFCATNSFVFQCSCIVCSLSTHMLCVLMLFLSIVVNIVHFWCFPVYIL